MAQSNSNYEQIQITNENMDGQQISRAYADYIDDVISWSEKGLIDSSFSTGLGNTTASVQAVLGTNTLETPFYQDMLARGFTDPAEYLRTILQRGQARHGLSQRATTEPGAERQTNISTNIRNLLT